MALQPHELKALAIELAAALPPPPARNLHDVLADAFALDSRDRGVLESYLRSSRVGALSSSRKASSEFLTTNLGGFFMDERG
ncbi:hypothetical protein [Luteimonas fraxinea]|uniref:hypothetical protein n=1 Tax=Luteimonas fraxinea TaxID=2901869 RepID=UPI001E365190|nr:hypothetical protein [Luteimonas fraxinea]MCD9126676.1 hypothetical protein [Luteimonas fraxinea]